MHLQQKKKKQTLDNTIVGNQSTSTHVKKSAILDPFAETVVVTETTITK